MFVNLTLDHTPRGYEVMEVEDGAHHYEEDGEEESSEEEQTNEEHIDGKVIGDPSGSRHRTGYENNVPVSAEF